MSSEHQTIIHGNIVLKDMVIVPIGLHLVLPSPTEPNIFQYMSEVGPLALHPKWEPGFSPLNPSQLGLLEYLATGKTPTHVADFLPWYAKPGAHTDVLWFDGVPSADIPF